MQLDLNTLINLGVLGAIAWLIRAMMDMRVTLQQIKTTLGINGHSDHGLVSRVKSLGERSHDHANKITILWAEREAQQRAQS